MAIKIEGSVVLNDPKIEPVIKSFRDLKNQIKSAKDELAGLEQGSDEYNRAAVKVGDLNDKMKDLNETIAQTSGAPMENLNSSFSILSSQVKSLDFEGVSSSLSTLWTTVAANPLLALVSVVSLVITNFDALKNLLPGLTNNVIDNSKAIEDNKLAYESAKIASDSFIKTLENEKKILELKNASASSLNKIDRQITDERIKQINQEIVTREKNIGSLIKTSAKEREQLEFIKNVRLANFQTESVIAEARAKLAESNKTTQAINAEKAAISLLRSELSLLNVEYDTAVKNRVIDKRQDISPIDDTEALNIAVNRATQINEAVKDVNDAYYQDGVEARSDFNIQIGQLADGLANETFEIERQLATGIAGIGEIVYQTKTKNLKKGSKEEQDAARKAFELEKGLRIANATTAGIEGGIQAFTRGTALGGPILGGIFAGAATAAALAGIIKIKNTKFTPSGQSAQLSPSASPSIPTTPPQSITPAPQTDLNEQGQAQVAQPYVSVKEINKNQNRVKVLETRASY